MAAFYRAIGGNYDCLFLSCSDNGLSFLYQTLGCFHSLAPPGSPFEKPRVPCLTPAGFARWQSIQILLCPEEQVGFLQKAVSRWNVPMLPSGTFPNSIPKECFPREPDKEVEAWHNLVTGKLKPQAPRRIDSFPYQNPPPPGTHEVPPYRMGIISEEASESDFSVPQVHNTRDRLSRVASTEKTSTRSTKESTNEHVTNPTSVSADSTSTLELGRPRTKWDAFCAPSEANSAVSILEEAVSEGQRNQIIEAFGAALMDRFGSWHLEVTSSALSQERVKAVIVRKLRRFAKIVTDDTPKTLQFRPKRNVAKAVWWYGSEIAEEFANLTIPVVRL